MILSIAIGGLLAGDVDINAASDASWDYDEFFIQYRNYDASQNSVYSLYMYESGNNTMSGSYRDSSSDSIIFVFDGECGYDYLYSDEDKSRTNETIWYVLCSSLLHYFQTSFMDFMLI